MDESCTPLFLSLLWEKIKCSVLYQYTLSTNLSFERKIGTWWSLSVFEVFFEEFKTIYLNLGDYSCFVDTKVEHVENQPLIDDILGSASEIESYNGEDSIKESTNNDYFEELHKYLAEQEILKTKIRFKDVQDYKKTFLSLIKDEAEYQQISSEVQETFSGTFSCTVISHHKRRVMLTYHKNMSKVYLKFGDFVRIRLEANASKVYTGHVVEIKMKYRQILVDLPSTSEVPIDSSSCHLDLIWRCVSSARMMASLHNLVKRDSNVYPCLKNYILGKEIQQKHFKAKIPGNFTVPGLPKLKESQLEIMKNCLENRLALIQGPPGTGKTVLIAAIAYYIVKHLKKKVLVCASSNKAVDNVYEKIKSTGIKVVRVRAKHPNFDKNLAKETTLQNIQTSTLPTESAVIRLQKVGTDDQTIDGFGKTDLSHPPTDKSAVNALIITEKGSVYLLT
ncbi:Regulator of nonsense transcripts 1 [Thelohanellus kitauei]|uniref:Regulator of nonsense transcripts 1 n=1 Tax=Thelohanellus kitauei TaxID=669202 RepID=A0A0C2IUY6_THEKT|nr:Regulator of nonsense transcripts 1 [Thelohanellus kitauei]